jgi:hypothetical protein
MTVIVIEKVFNGDITKGKYMLTVIVIEKMFNGDIAKERYS